MKTIILGLSNRITLVWLLLLSPGVIAVTGSNRLDQIDFSTLPGNRVQLQLIFAQLAQNPISFSTDNPARIVLDFPNTSIGLRKKSQAIGVGVVQGTSAVETEDRSRVVIDLVRMVPFDIKVMGKRILIAVDNQGSQTFVDPAKQSLDMTKNILTTKAVAPTGFQLIAGERRLRAAELASLTSIPALVRRATDEQLHEWALVENIHRVDLNPIERAKAYQEYISTFSLTQAEAADDNVVGMQVAVIFTHVVNTFDTLRQCMQEVQGLKSLQAFAGLPVDKSA